jgi:hypothetical protein
MAARHRVWTGLLALSLVPMALLGAPSLATVAPPPEGAGAASLIPNADATLRSWHPATNYGAEPTIEASYGEIDVPTAEFSLIRFDLAAVLPPEAIIDSAALELLTISGVGLDPITLDARLVTAEWQEATVTWETRPTTTRGQLEILASSAVPAVGGALVSWDLTYFAKGWHSGRGGNYGIELSGPLSGGLYRRLFASREDAAHTPRLIISYHLPTPTTRPTATPPPGLDLQIAHVELTQAIQCKGHPAALCADNAVPMVAGKETFVRVYVKPADSSGAVPNVTGRVTAHIGGADVVAYPLNPTITAQLSPQRANFADTLNFYLPSAKVSESGTLTVEINPEHTVAETNYANNVTSMSLSFVKTPPLTIVPISMSYTADGSGVQMVDPTMPWFMKPYIEHILPVGEVSFHLLPNPVLPFSGPIGSESSWGAILQALADLQQKSTGVPAGAHWYVMVPFFVPQGNIAGYGSVNGTLASGRVPVGHENLEDGADILVHELGHNLGRQHAPCSVNDPDPNYPYPYAMIGDNGWDPQGAAGGKVQSFPQGYVVPASSFDIMSYCQDEWISEYTYRAILQRRGSASAQAEAAPAIGPDAPYLFVAGEIGAGGARFEPWSILDRPAGFSDHPGEGPYTLRLISAQGATLFERAFRTTQLMAQLPPGAQADAPLQEAAAALFYEIMPWQAETAAIQLWEGQQLLGERQLSAHAPMVELLAPQAGARWTAQGSYSIEWRAQDADGDALWYDVALSRDGGASWAMLATRLRATRLAVSGAQLPGAEQALVRVFASDGVRTASATVGPLVIEPKGPEVVIVSPAGGGAVPLGAPVRLAGYAYDREQGALVGEALQWHSDRDGALGRGEELIVSDLSWGRHTITLQATDSASLSGSAQIVLHVGHALMAPLVTR